MKHGSKKLFNWLYFSTFHILTLIMLLCSPQSSWSQSNDRNALTNYSTYGFANPSNSNSIEDYKPDLIAPGGSKYYTYVISVDTGVCDGDGRADINPNDCHTHKMSLSIVLGMATTDILLLFPCAWSC